MLIGINKKIPLDKFIYKSLYDKDYGYYIKKNPLGKKGDFITSPNISILFSEMISIWLISFWESLKKPKKINIVELGAGNGEMMSQIIKTLGNFNEISLSANFLIIEKSPLLLKIQQNIIDKKKVSWIKNFKDIPKAPTIFLANEFFDAFPIKQFLKKSNNWYEKYISFKKNKFEVYNKKVPSKIIEKYLGKDIKKENFVEYSPSAMKFVNKISNFIFKNNGGLLMIDYGFTSGKMKNTLQSVEKHRKINFLENPYNSDITHLINFKLYKKEFANSNLKSLITTQGNFLIKLGILKRAEIISKNYKFIKKADIFYRVKRLIDEKYMGSLFKVLFVSKSRNNFNLGFK
tara:strand:- start:780 stop:1820 length:1041 start_codon:yes stop_codon:yes gene_type:complete